MPSRPRKKPGRNRFLVIDPDLDRRFEELFCGEYGQTYTRAVEDAMRRHLASPPPKPVLPPLPPVLAVGESSGEPAAPGKGHGPRGGRARTRKGKRAGS
jgi:hypothetical protein